MLLTITTTHQPATDLGYLLHKNPAKSQQVELTFGVATVFYPEASEERCTAAMVVEVDPVGLVRKGGGAFALEQYVNDRPYVASSLMCVALTKVFGTAMSGTCKQRPELAAMAIPLEVTLPVLPCRGGEGLLKSLFEPLGYAVEATRLPLDEKFPEWGEGPYYTVTLRHTVRLTDFLSHLYVLVPVLDNDKHYWVDEAEVEKLLRHGEGWLATHPARDTITLRYLRYLRRLQRNADEGLAALTRLELAVEPDADAGEPDEPPGERVKTLNDQRHDAVVDALKATGAGSVLDLGCAEGKLLRRLLDEKQFARIAGLDVSTRALEVASERLHLDRMPEARRRRIELLHGSLIYRDRRLEGFDAACLVEVIEHLEPSRLDSLERVVFGHARPLAVIVTTPNIEHNTRFATLATGKLRHGDHRFEWTRAEFGAWASRVAEKFGYSVTHQEIGESDPEVGPPTQMATFRREGSR